MDILAFFSKKKKNTDPPVWYKELLKVAREHKIDEWYSYVPPEEQHWVDKLPPNIQSKINMCIRTGSEMEYYYEFHF